MEYLILARRQDPMLIYKKKGTCPLVDVAVLADHKEKIHKNEKIDKYLDLTWELP